MKKTAYTRFLSMLLALVLVSVSLVIPSYAAQIEDATLDSSAECSLTVYNYDYTTASKNGIWNKNSYVSTGTHNDAVINKLSDGGLAIKGAEFSYLKVAEIVQHTANGNQISLLFKFDKTAAADLLEAIGLKDGSNSNQSANATDASAWFYASDVLNTALSDALSANPTTVKNALEAYIQANGGATMPLTDSNGCTYAEKLPIGLYLLVETKVPENTSVTVNPCFISLPMTTIDGTAWNYDVTVYPKNETSVVTLQKTAISRGVSGKNLTVSGGDTVKFEICSTLPVITSNATALSEYTFVDTMAKGLSYDSNTGMTIEWYSDTACKNLVTTWAAGSDMFTNVITKNQDGSNTITVTMTAKGLAAMIAYSQHTMKISYTATVNSDESLVYGDAGNCNSVVLTWTRTSTGYSDTLIDDVHLYSYGIDLTKIFSDGKSGQDLFDQVLFKVQHSDTLQYLTAALNETEGVWYITGSVAAEADATEFHPVTWNGNPGHLVIKGLDGSSYTLTEIETAEGYILLEESIVVQINTVADTTRPCEVYNTDTTGVVQTGLDHNLLTASATVNGDAAKVIADDKDTASTNALVTLQVTNSLGFDLPDTGDLGIFLLPIIGTVGVISTLVLILMLTKSKRKEETV